MPIRVGVPLAKNNSIKRQNSNLLQEWLVTQGETNARKIFIQDNNAIGTIFNELDFTQGSTGASSDQLRIFSISGSFVNYFFRSDVQKWRLTNNRSGPDQENVVIDNKSIIAFTKAISGSKTITLKETARVGVYQ
jgi:glycosidase